MEFKSELTELTELAELANNYHIKEGGQLDNKSSFDDDDDDDKSSDDLSSDYKEFKNLYLNQNINKIKELELQLLIKQEETKQKEIELTLQLQLKQEETKQKEFEYKSNKLKIDYKKS
jgi:hypothetical protein